MPKRASKAPGMACRCLLTDIISFSSRNPVSGWVNSSSTTYGISAGGFCNGIDLSPVIATTAVDLNTILDDWSYRACAGVLHLQTSSGTPLALTKKYTFEMSSANITIMPSPTYTSGRIVLLSPAGEGHLMVRNGAKLWAYNLEFVNSTSGGVVFEYGGWGTLSNCVFQGNRNRNVTDPTFKYYGAGNTSFSGYDYYQQYPALAAINATVTCYNCTLKDNTWTVYSPYSGSGGSALKVSSGSYGSFYDTTFINNTVMVADGGKTGGGGAVSVEMAASITFEGCHWYKNKVVALATASYGVRGGAIEIYDTPQVSLYRCDFASNSIEVKANNTEAGFAGAVISGRRNGANKAVIKECRYENEEG